MRARIYRSSQREFDCKILETKDIVKATALGNLLKSADLVVGDFVELTSEGDEYIIQSREERTSEIYRQLPRERKKKVTAANCDRLILLTSVSKPDYKQGAIDRFLLRAHQWQIKPIIVFNKMDEFDESFDLKFEEKRFAPLGVESYEISALNPDYRPKYLEKGLVELKADLNGLTAIMLGQSGVGKSKTITSLTGGKVELLSREIGKVGKGSHTTTWSEIVDCEDFTLIDSPGMRSISINDIPAEGLIEYFPDLEELAIQCKFNNCTHEENVKGCAFWQLDQNLESTEIIISRLYSYFRMRDEIEAIPDYLKG